MWWWGRHATQHVGEARASGARWQRVCGAGGGGLGQGTWNPTAGQCQAPGDRVMASRVRDSEDVGIFVIGAPRGRALTVCQAQC